MKTLTLELHDDQTFNGRITHDGRVIASVSGNVDLVTATGAVQEFAAVFGTIQKQAWHKTHSEITPWRITCLSVNGIASQWHMHLPGHSILSFGNEAAAISARAAAYNQSRSLEDRRTAYREILKHFREQHEQPQLGL